MNDINDIVNDTMHAATHADSPLLMVKDAIDRYDE